MWYCWRISPENRTERVTSYWGLGNRQVTWPPAIWSSPNPNRWLYLSPKVQSWSSLLQRRKLNVLILNQQWPPCNEEASVGVSGRDWRGWLWAGTTVSSLSAIQASRPSWKLASHFSTGLGSSNTPSPKGSWSRPGNLREKQSGWKVESKLMELQLLWRDFNSSNEREADFYTDCLLTCTQMSGRHKHEQWRAW